ncbi:MAG: ribosomal RNA small subunit methyltransferase A [Proteobacteria bacterium]|nr:ribosomal RNA small subunit methyltransferase A [Pseudomonadota bacterium]
MNVKKELKQLGLSPSKRLGQNFLFDENLAKKIVNSFNGNGHVIEIGPGLGVLSKYIVNRFPDTVFIEKDPLLFNNLRLLYPDTNIVLQDALKFDFNRFGSYSVISNLPYSISKNILRKFISSYPHMEEAVLMLQKEVVERLISPAGNKKYGVITILTRLFYNVEKLFNVSKNVFYPKPDVDSSVVRLEKRDSLPLNNNETDDFISFVKVIFSSRRKKISTNLGISDKNNKKLSLRAEDLSLEKLIELYRELKSSE